MPKDTRALTRATGARQRRTGETYTAARDAVLAAYQQADSDTGIPVDERGVAALPSDATPGAARSRRSHLASQPR
jgi:hypothetical protein